MNKLKEKIKEYYDEIVELALNPVYLIFIMSVVAGNMISLALWNWISG